MKDSKHFMERLAVSADLSDEPIPCTPLIEIAGSGRVLIEHHTGVTQYSCERIGVKVNYGQVMVSGRDLVLTRMTKEQLIISGCIETVHLIKGE